MTGILIRQDAPRPYVYGVTARSAEEEYTLNTDCIFLAIGHSARDTFAKLRQQEIAMERKPFSVGLRIEHLQEDIDVAQYGGSAQLMRKFSGPADYKLSYHASNGRGVYTFCMCPGGFVVGAASEQGGLVTNGMSNYDRAERNANAAILVSVFPEDFAGEDVLSGVEFQRRLERDAFALGGSSWKAPCQLVGDFLTGRFDCPDAVLTGCETRSSSPVRILRDNTGCSVSMAGLYPVGEGAGYAGGILSAAADGTKTVEKWLETL